jgi:hypothetical protein
MLVPHASAASPGPLANNGGLFLSPPEASPMADEQITTGPRGDGPPTGRERRSQPRRRSRGSAFALFAVPPSLRAFRVTIWDAAPCGISFLHDAPLEPGDVLALQLGAGLPGVSWLRTARVAHATPHERGWLIGCRVSPPLSARELESL